MSIPTPPATPPGWYPNGPVQRYWDGTAWTEHTAPLAPVTVGSSPPPAPVYAVTTSRKTTNHAAHLVATIFTCGLWLPIWIIDWAVKLGRTPKSVTRFK